jgi:hypothetical protein
MTIDSEENNLYLLSSDMKRVMVTNLVSKRIFKEIDVSEGSYWISMMGEK